MTGSFPLDGMELTQILVVADVTRARSFYRDVLGAEVYREYGGTSCVLRAFGTWLLLVHRRRADRRQADGHVRGTH